MNDASASSLISELNWFKRVLNYRLLQDYDQQERPAKIVHLATEEQGELVNAKVITDILPPELSGDDRYATLIRSLALNAWERIVLVLAVLPHVAPELLSVLNNDSRSEYGGVKGAQFRGLLPTGHTALYVLGGTDYEFRCTLQSMFGEAHKFRKANILWIGDVQKGEPEMSGVLTPSREVLDIILLGEVRPPDFGNDFPAKRITTQMTWDDLVLAPVTQRQVEEVKVWVRHRETLLSELGMGKRMKPGYKILFHGGPGTGKTLTACLLGQYTNKHVFRIDLSMIVSKYIGETEKNLAKIFDKAEHADWILFFDEADALFGSRTKVSSSHDRYANQEVSYLLQRIEDYSGIVVLATNMRSNIDEAFARRFQSVVHFPFPKPEERLQLWKKAMPEKLTLSDDVDMKKLADRYEMSGANITNIVAWCALMSLEKGDLQVTDSMLREGMARELAKEGRTM